MLFQGYCLLLTQTAVVAVHIAQVNHTTDGVGNGSEGEAQRQADALLHKAHEQRADADAHIVGKHVGSVGHTPLRSGSGAGNEGLEQRLQNAIAQTKEEPGGQQMDAAVQEQIAEHGQNQHRQADVHQHTVPPRVDHLLGGQLGDQHARHQEDVEVGQEGRQAFLLGEDGGIGDHRTVGDHQEHHIEHEGQCRAVNGVPNGEFLPLYLGVPDTAAGYADQRGHGDAEDGPEGGGAAHVALHLQAHIGAHCHADGHGERKSADALGNFGNGQNVTCQGHGGGAAHRVHRAHIQTDHNERAEQGGRPGMQERTGRTAPGTPDRPGSG